MSLLVLLGVAFNVILASAQPAAAESDSKFIVEGDSGTSDFIFVVSLSTAGQGGPTTVDYFTSNGTASASKDYKSTRGTLTFFPGETRKVVDVPVIGDRHPEGDETFFLNVTGSRAMATIIDDDPSIAIGGVTVAEGDANTHDAAFVVTLSVPAASDAPPGGRTPQPVEVSYATSDGTALSGIDYVSTQGTLVFSPGETSKIIAVLVIGDVFPERDETFFVNLSDPSRGEISTVQAQGVILNDDAVAFTGEPPAGFETPGGPVPPGARPSVPGVRSVTASGDVVVFGNAGFFGSAAELKVNRPIVGTAATPTRNGYWLVAADGGIFAFGDARFFGSTGAIALNRPIVGMAATPTGNGYWLVAADGGIFAFGDAPFLGSKGGTSQAIVGMAATPTGNGYWLMGRGGELLPFGDATSFAVKDVIPGIPIVGIAV